MSRRGITVSHATAWLFQPSTIGNEKFGETMNLLEAPICAKALARLRSKGWRVGCEIRTDNRRIDAAAILHGKVLALEAKISLNEKLRHQLKRLTIRADYVLGVVGSPPRKEGINCCVKHRSGCG